MTLDGIKCSVDTCRFWAAGNRCEADKIEVDVNTEAADRSGGRAGGGGAGMEIGEIAGRYRRGVIEPEEDFFELGELGSRREDAGVPGPARGGPAHGGPGQGGPGQGGPLRGGSARAQQSEHTCCRTFRPR